MLVSTLKMLGGGSSGSDSVEMHAVRCGAVTVILEHRGSVSTRCTAVPPEQRGFAVGCKGRRNACKRSPHTNPSEMSRQ